MKEVFAGLYNWFGIIPVSKDLNDHLRGFDIGCEDFLATNKYLLVGWIMIALTIFGYALQYHIVDRRSYSQKHHWWITAMVIFLLNFAIAFLIPYNDIRTMNYCVNLQLQVLDCYPYAISNGVWSLLLFLLMTSTPFPRKLSTNCSYTTFWKP